MRGATVLEEWKEANSRVVYVSGPHGAGKSTVFKGLASTGVVVSEQNVHFSLDEIVDRQLWRIFIHFLEHRINLQKALEYPKDIVIGDRCILDDEAYHEAFHRLGWISDNEYRAFEYLIGWLHFFFRTPAPKQFIIIIPPFEWNQERIKARWQQGERKWREANWKYLREVRGVFEGLTYKHNSLVLRETDEDLRLAQVRGWIERLRRGC